MLQHLIKLFIGGLIAFVLLVLVVWSCNFWVEYSTRKQVFDSITSLPTNDVGVVLGTSRYTKRGYDNPYFYNRIRAAVELYERGKIKHIIVSGDNSLKEYNEPKHMRKALINRGIPEKVITMDFAGFRTLDSVVRSKKVFGQKSITIISQEFHNQRAAFIANYRGVEAVGFNAEDVPLGFSWKTRIREYFARCKAVLDIVILNKQPKFLGEEIIIDIE